MDAIKGNINSILNGYKQFIIPVYQRTYSWEIEQCKRLWDDLVALQKQNRAGHFVGSIVNIAEQAMPTGVQKYMIIDGQQRMTTLTLLLLAVRDYGHDNPDDTSIDPMSINGMCIQNDYGKNEDKYKLLLTQSDKDTLIKLIERSPLDTAKSSRLLENYYYFEDMIKKGELTASQIIEGIAKLQIVNITLDRAVDDAQLIFESLNSTGMDLSHADLIRNYVLMGLNPEEQQTIYNNYWLPMEKLFSYEKQNSIMDKFFRDYLTFKNGKIPNMNKIYVDFKLYHHNKVVEPIHNFCSDLYTCAKYYTDMLYASSGDKNLDLVLKNINELQMDVALPFLLRVYSDYKAEMITKEDFITILRLCESYVFRRAICGIPTNSFNKTFMLVMNKIDAIDYLNSVKAFFVLQDSYKVFPSDTAFIEAFKVKDVYNTRVRNYFLSKFENYSNKAPINIENYTIEHIMPQNKNLSKDWQESLGSDWKEVWQSHLHTIGNLTLSAYNSEMSDRPFLEKLEMTGGFKESALRINNYVIKQTTWSKEHIEERADELCELARKIWKYPDISDEELEKFLPEDKISSNFSLSDFEYLDGNILELFSHLDKRIQNISADVKREVKKLYIAYKADTNFVDIVPQKIRLRLSINMKFSEINDPKNICKDVTDKGRWGNGDIEIGFESLSQLDDVMDIIQQSYNSQID